MTRKAGAIVINRLRDRIRLGRYFGRWRPGDRLPSVREVAELEDVDRKTAAAAYRRLQDEGLVRVEPRSGVYLEGEREEEVDPLRRLHLSWLARTLETSEELGLDAETLSRMFQGVLAVHGRRVPVVDPDPDHGELLARELSRRTGLDCVATQPEQLPARVGPLRDPPFIVATPRGADRLGSASRRRPIVAIQLSAGLFEAVCEAADEDAVEVRVGSRALKQELEHALERGLTLHPERIRVVDAERRGSRTGRWRADGGSARGDGNSADSRTEGAHGEDRGRRAGDGRGVASGRVVTWPGADPGQAGQAARAGRAADGGGGLIAAETIDEIRCQVARAALEHLSTSTVSSRPARPDG